MRHVQDVELATAPLVWSAAGVDSMAAAAATGGVWSCCDGPVLQVPDDGAQLASGASLRAVLPCVGRHHCLHNR